MRKIFFFAAVQIEKTEINILQKNGKKSFFTTIFFKEKEENYFKISTDFRVVFRRLFISSCHKPLLHVVVN